MTNAAGESISSISIWIIVDQIGKHDFSGGLIKNNLKETSSDQMNKISVNAILTRRDWNCSTM